MRLVVLSLLISVIFVPIVLSDDVQPLPIVYCKHMGYNIWINETDNKPMCDFGDGLKCYTDDFYKGLCGQGEILSIPIRQAGEDVYVELGEKCADGLIISSPQYLLDQPKCIQKPWYQDILNFFKNYC